MSRGSRSLERMLYVCEECGGQVRPASDPGLKFAVRVVRTVAMGPTMHDADGAPVVFHEWCFPTGSPDYRVRPRPEGMTDGDE
jgi:hypothetical protein